MSFSPFTPASFSSQPDLPERREELVFEEAFEATIRGEGVVHGTLVPAIPKRRFTIGTAILLVMLLGFLARAIHLQIVEGPSYRSVAEGNRIRTRTVTPPRGLIQDRFGRLLAENQSIFVLTMTPGDLPKGEERNQVLNRIADLSGLQRTDFDLLISARHASPFDPVLVKKNIPYETALRLAMETTHLPAFRLEVSSVRSYPMAISSLSHILGYVGNVSEAELANPAYQDYRPTDMIGKTGIERSGETLLRGRPGKTTVEVDARGRELSLIEEQQPTPGKDIILTIDADFQRFAEEQLTRTLRQTGTHRGTVIALDPKDGSVRALVSLPSFDNNAFARGIDPESYQALLEDPNHPLFFRAISGEFPSGSTFKPFVAYAALKEGIIGEHTSFISTGGISVGPWFFPDWKAGGHGIVDVRTAIANSVNTFFYIIGGGFEKITGLGVDRITRYARDFGFGEPTGIELPNETDGFLPSKEWKERVKGERWYVGDTYHLSIGQGDLLVTPIQMVTAGALIANGGGRVRPRLIEAVDQTPVTPGILPSSFDPELITIVRQGMRQTVTAGSAQSLSLLSKAVAGKTGTAQTPGDRPTHAWFLGFGPYQNPDIVLLVLIEEGGEGSSVAVPLARDLFEWWFAHPQVSS